MDHIVVGERACKRLGYKVMINRLRHTGIYMYLMLGWTTSMGTRVGTGKRAVAIG